MIKLLALTITITPAWWMLLAVFTMAWGIYAIQRDVKAEKITQPIHKNKE